MSVLHQNTMLYAGAVIAVEDFIIHKALFHVTNLQACFPPETDLLKLKILKEKFAKRVTFFQDLLIIGILSCVHRIFIALTNAYNKLFGCLMIDSRISALLVLNFAQVYDRKRLDSTWFYSS